MQSSSKNLRIIVIGGGAAGLIAAIVAARNGAKVVILESSDRFGKKILATGNGRCNFTNINLDIEHFHGKNPKFAHAALGSFDFQQTISFFEYLGISHRIEDGGKVFPFSGQASSILDVLRYELKQLGVVEHYGSLAIGIKPNKDGFTVLLQDSPPVHGDKVILTTEGQASPQLGSNGSGYKLAEALGHNLVDPIPALVQLKLHASFLKAVKGVKFIGEACIIRNNNTLRRESGEILFTDYGISGPPVLQLSRTAAVELAGGQKTYIQLDMFPELEEGDLMDLLKLRLGYQPEKPLEFSFIGLINNKLIPVILNEAGVLAHKKQCQKVTSEELKNIATIFKNWKIEILGTQSWNNAQITAGGIDVVDVDARSMMSKLVTGFYLAGEILDIDGDCGGFNLQWAWSSGFVAGDHAST